MATRKLPMKKPKSFKKQAKAGIVTNTIKKIDPLPFLNQFYPEKKFFIRKFHNLWDNFYRVNYHWTIKANQIKHSYFVEVKEVPLAVIPISEAEAHELSEM